MTVDVLALTGLIAFAMSVAVGVVSLRHRSNGTRVIAGAVAAEHSALGEAELTEQLAEAVSALSEEVASVSESLSVVEADLAILAPLVLEGETEEPTESEGVGQAGEQASSISSSALAAERKLLETLSLSDETLYALRRGGLTTIADVVSMTEGQLASIWKASQTTIAELKEALASQGLELRQPRRGGRRRPHKQSSRRFGHRQALYANLTASLIEHGSIRTTETKAKAVRPMAEKMITLGLDGTIHARRQALAYLRSQEVVNKLFSEVAPRFRDRPGGYTRMIKLGQRESDAAPMAELEIIDFRPSKQRRRKRRAPATERATESTPE